MLRRGSSVVNAQLARRSRRSLLASRWISVGVCQRARLQERQRQKSSPYNQTHVACLVAGLALAIERGSSSGAQAETLPDEVGSRITFEQVAKIPRPGLSSIGEAIFTPDDAHVLFLRASEYGSLRRQLYVTEIATGKTRMLAMTPPGTGEEENLTLEEKLRRERARTLTTGVTSFQVQGLAGSPGRILVPMGGALYVQDGVAESSGLTKLFDPAAAPLGPGPILDPRLSDDGSKVCFVWSNELYIVSADGSGQPRKLTTGAEGGVTHGLADFLAQEELDRYTGFWMTPDASWVAYEEVDESHIPQYRIMHQGNDAVGPDAQEDHRYPFAGKPNPVVRLWIVNTDAGCPGVPAQFDLTGPFGDDCYLVRVHWLPGGTVLAEVMNREQTELAVLRFDPATGHTSTLFTERSDVWVNYHNMLKPVGASGELLWASERTGHRHLYLWSPTGMRPITSGKWQVDSIVSIDAEARVVYFMGTGPCVWLDSQMYSVALDGHSDPVRLTQEAGMHRAHIDHRHETFVDVVHSVSQPAVATLRSIKDGRELFTIFKNEDPAIEKLELSVPEFVTFPSKDGQVLLQGAVYRPDPNIFGLGPYPTVVSCYGGPHVQFVQNSWSMRVDLRAQQLVNRGFLVVKTDNRGSNRRGLHFEGAVKHKMGNVEVDDQVAGVHYAVTQGLADPKAVGIYGWSYGGYLSAMCLAKAPEVFKCAVVGAPVTSWDGYDTCYTERYMGTPQSNPQGYKEGSVMEHVKNIAGDLLLVHGLLDENVHFRHTARLINSLIAAQIPYQLLLFPNERHSPRSQKDREYMEEHVYKFIKQSLTGRPE